MMMSVLGLNITILGLGPVGAPMGDNVPFDVIMYNEDDEVMEATIANVAIEVRNPESGTMEWITPPLSSGRSLNSLFFCPYSAAMSNIFEIPLGILTLTDRIPCFTSRIVERDDAP
jgi:hypothetical protein